MLRRPVGIRRFARLNKYEKEIGFCQVKLEKERRLRKQIAFLESEIFVVDKQISRFGVSLNSFDASDAPNSLELFLACELMDTLQDRRLILVRERNELRARCGSFEGISSRLETLAGEKDAYLRGLTLHHSQILRRQGNDFSRVESRWKSFSEDILNLDDGLFFLERNLDYLRSCRTFVVSSVREDFESWPSAPREISIVLKHSNLGRAKEMADGADRTLKMAQKQLICVANAKIYPEQLVYVLLDLLQAIYKDTQITRRTDQALYSIECAMAKNLRAVERMKNARESHAQKLTVLQKERMAIFSRLGLNRDEVSRN